MIPQSRDEISEHTPETLSNLPVPPVFLFRPATSRDKRAFNRALMVEGLCIHDKEAMRSAMRSELRRLWSDEDRDRELARLEALWATMDQNETLPENDRIEVTAEEWKAYEELSERAVQASVRLREMQADNADFYTYAPKLALGLFLIGWRSLDAPFQRTGGTVSIDTIDLMGAALAKVETQAALDKIEGVGAPGTAAMLLEAHALSLLNLTGDQESKSASPSPSSKNQVRSKKQRPPAAGGKSQVGGTTEKTLAA